jgi:cold shock CspA family protein
MDSQTPRGRFRGIVSRFYEEHGFGFIETSTGDVFVHRNALEGILLMVGDHVEFSVYQAGQGACAVNIQWVFSSTMEGV